MTKKKKIGQEVIVNLKKDRSDYDQQITKQSELLDKSVLTISAAMFNIAIMFVDKIVPLSTSNYLCLFILSLVLYAISVVCTLVSFKVSMDKAIEAVKAVDEAISKNEECTIPSSWNCLLNLLNRLSLWGAVCATIFLTIFLTMNLIGENECQTSLMIPNHKIHPADPPALPPLLFRYNIHQKGKVLMEADQ